jgi:hypothetical protein
MEINTTGNEEVKTPFIPKIELKQKDGIVKIYINDLIHITFRVSDLVGIQSWLDGSENVKYTIEYTLKGGVVILSEYFVREKWIKILQLLDTVKL